MGLDTHDSSTLEAILGEMRSLPSLRDQFAMALITGLMARYGSAYHSDEEAIDEAFRLADYAMLKARQGA